MPKIVNIFNNILLSIDLVNNDKADYIKGRDDFENWIPFEFFLNIDGELYSYPIEYGAMLNVFEIKNIISKLEKIISLKSENVAFEKVGISCIDRYFDMEIYDSLEKSQFYIVLWIMTGVLTNGEKFGYDKGFRFTVSLECLQEFLKEFKIQASPYLT